MRLLPLTINLLIMKQKEEKWVYLVWVCDQWMSGDSMVLMQVTDTFDTAVKEIMENIILDKTDWEDYDGETNAEKIEALREYVEEYLIEHDQTPSLTTNYVIHCVAVNGIWGELAY